VSILTYIARWGGADMVEWMLKQGIDPKRIGDNNQNLLFDAGDARTAEILLAAGVDPNHVDEFGRTPLASAQSGEIARKLIAAGAKPKVGDSGISEMIYSYASAGALEEVIKSLGKIDPIEAQKGLIAAAHIDRDEIAKILLAHGARANEPGYWGRSNSTILPLMECTVHGSPKTAKVLLEHGADPNKGESFGLPLQNAIQNGHKDVAKILREAGAKGVSDLAFHLAMGEAEKVGPLLTSAPRFDDHPDFWSKVLPTAARYGHVETVRVALARGVPLAATPEDNAFTAAAGEGQHEVLSELLAHRKKPHDPAELKQALWNAIWNSNPYKEQRPAEAFERCVSMLLEAGARAEATNDEGPLVVTAVFTRNPGGNPKVIEMLVAAGADPNPRIGGGDRDKPRHLVDMIQDACTEQGCSTPFARTIAAVEKAAKIVVKH
jgi:ankyrin repeat protein